jgi:hypothetical protein
MAKKAAPKAPKAKIPSDTKLLDWIEQNNPLISHTAKEWFVETHVHNRGRATTLRGALTICMQSQEIHQNEQKERRAIAA